MSAVEVRFWAKVNKNGPVPRHRPELGPCWVWTGARSSDGYGSIRIDGRTLGVHRASFLAAGGELSAGPEVCHHCDNRPCVRPSHLFSGTHLDNVRDMHAKGRARKATGDANASRLYPERRPRGDNHPARLHPERWARGDRSGARLHPESRARGENNGASKLTALEVAAIRERHACGASQYSLAKVYGVSKTTIRNIVRGKTWVAA